MFIVVTYVWRTTRWSISGPRLRSSNVATSKKAHTSVSRSLMVKTWRANLAALAISSNFLAVHCSEFVTEWFVVGLQ